MANQAGFTAEGATIALGSSVITKLGKVMVHEGHIGLLEENGDLIASALASSVEVKKTLFYFAVPTILVIIDGKKYRINLSYEASIEAGLDDATAKERQYGDNDRFFAAIREAGGKI